MSATNSATLSATLTPTVVAGSYPFASSQVAWKPASSSYGSGTTPGNIDQTYQVQLTPGTAGTSVQFNGGGLLDPVGDTLSFARLDALAITNTGANALNLTGSLFTSGYAAGGSFSIPVGPGGTYLHSPGTAASTAISCGSGTNSTLTLTGVGGTTTAQVCAVGRSV